MKALVIVILVGALGAGGFFLWKKGAADQANEAEGDRATTAIVESRDISFAVIVAGEIAPAEQVSVRPEINGKIAMLNVDVGDKAKKGQVLFTLDDKELQNQKAASVTEIDRTKVQLGQADRNFKRSQQLHGEKLISQELFETSRTELALASNALERAQRDLSVLDEKLSKTVIMAPFDCTVLTRPVSVGQAVSGSGGVSGGTEVLTIADLNQMVINAHVNQADVTRLKVGLPVQVAVEAILGLQVEGAVERIAPQATIRNNIKGFATRIIIKNIDQRVQPGMTANITIPVATAQNVLSVPLGAVFTELGERYVYVKTDEGFEKRPVQIGLSDYFYAEVASGLKTGEVVFLEIPQSEIAKLGKGPTPKPGSTVAGGMSTGSRLATSARDGRSQESASTGGGTPRTNSATSAPPRTGKSGG